MTNLTMEQFLRIVVRKLENITNNVVLQNPTTQMEFPLKVVRTPMENILKTENGQTVKKRISITIEEWNDTKYGCIRMADSTSAKLLELNLTKSSNDIDIYDDITKKYRLISNYEVFYNGIYDSFELTK